MDNNLLTWLSIARLNRSINQEKAIEFKEPAQKQKISLLSHTGSLWWPKNIQELKAQNLPQELTILQKLIVDVVDFMSAQDLGKIGALLFNPFLQFPSLDEFAHFKVDRTADLAMATSLLERLTPLKSSIKTTLEKRTRLIQNFNQVTECFFALRIFNHWIPPATRLPLTLMQLKNELEKLKNTLSQKKFTNLRFETTVNSELKKEFDSLLLQFRALRKKVLEIETKTAERDAQKVQMETQKENLPELSSDIEFFEESLYKEEEIVKEAPPLQRITEAGNRLFDQLTYVLDVTFYEVIALGALLENEFFLLSMAFEFEIPLNQLRQESLSIETDVNIKKGTVGPSKDLHQSKYQKFIDCHAKLQTFKKTFGERSKGCVLFTSELLDRLKKQTSPSLDAAFQKITSSMTEFNDGITRAISSIHATLTQAAATLDFLDTEVVFKEGGTGYAWVLGPNLYHMSYGSNTARSVIPPPTTQTEDQEVKLVTNPFVDLLSKLKEEPLLATKAPFPVSVKEAPKLGTTVDLETRLDEFKREMESSIPKSKFFTVLMRSGPSSDQELIGGWDDELTSASEIQDAKERYLQMKEELKNFLLFQNPTIHLCQLASMLLYSLKKATKYDQESCEISKHFEEVQKKLDELKNALKKYENIEFDAQGLTLQEFEELYTNFAALIQEKQFTKVHDFVKSVRVFSFSDGDFLGVEEEGWVRTQRGAVFSREKALFEAEHRRIKKSMVQLVPTDSLTKEFVFRIQFLFKVTFKVKTLVSESDELNSHVQTHVNEKTRKVKKLTESVHVKEAKVKTSESGYKRLRGKFEGFLSEMKNFQTTRNEEESQFKRGSTQLLDELEMHKRSFVNFPNAVNTFNETKTTIQGHQERALKQIKVSQDYIYNKLTHTAVLFDQMKKKEEVKASVLLATHRKEVLDAETESKK